MESRDCKNVGFAGAIFIERHNHVFGQPVFDGVVGEAPILQTRNAAALRADPDAAVATFINGACEVMTQPVFSRIVGELAVL